ncbi:DUF4386 domain-containing protein [Maribacter halichondriae]|uniref:DUF4386 domain-containing protein n=1 Tax=Maribacter halichondriae TaxID=2980554 RepID=UPI002359E6B1|nr:DUF4386 domain-containing protein [Maribacter sp. Hal144]
MKSKQIANRSIDFVQKKAAKIAGFMFLFILTAVLVNSYVFSQLIVAGNALATSDNIMANTGLLRVGIGNELILSIAAILLALALYIILKPVNRNFALLGFSLKLTEAILSAVIALLNFVALQILNGDAASTVLPPEQLKTLVGSFLNMHDVLYAIPMVFLGLNLVVFSYLFLKSKYIPRLLAGFGIISYALVFLFALASILFPNLAVLLLAVPSILFELIIGLWLLLKGVNLSAINSEVVKTDN